MITWAQKSYHAFQKHIIHNMNSIDPLTKITTYYMQSNIPVTDVRYIYLIKLI